MFPPTMLGTEDVKCRVSDIYFWDIIYMLSPMAIRTECDSPIFQLGMLLYTFSVQARRAHWRKLCDVSTLRCKAPYFSALFVIAM